MRKTVELHDRLGWRDYFQITTTAVMVVMSIYILWQTCFARWAIPSLIFGVVLLLYSLFRIRMIWAYFGRKGKRNVI